ncbi:DUF3592 domain-containing protein [Rhodopseudomonas sp. P2A-2r]|uniref:DUF3592 domain-containing protein n=1 Tax=unclassified Rhodopseudomonas TaxID=2638247 RepID=UPI002233F36B|nr:DUF3592 domain-containing protein [Rhodopseudomonas sp. P2A-2r]UZE48777.1 DUF3592 domain-containing protein [Rhodopseudomonas sp. P2A-2r]
MPDIPWYAYAIVLSPAVLFLIAATWKYLQVRAASDWPSTPGKVVVSTSEVRDVKVIDDTRADRQRLEQRNFANIVYEYTVSGQKLRNNRVDIGENRGNFEVAETIARYPVGADVTVYYNPRHPRDAVLERDLPKGAAGCLAWGIVIVLVIVFGGAFGGKHMADYVAAHLADPKLSPLVMALGAFGFFIALFGLALHRQSRLARSWPVVPGVIKLSGVETYQSADSDTGRAGPMMHERKVTYSYRFNHIAYIGSAGSISTSNPSPPRWQMRLFGMDYQNGAAVRVFVNPANPTDSTLNPGGGAAWFLWAIAAGFAVAAGYVATHG